MNEVVTSLIVIPATRAFVWAFVFIVVAPVAITGAAVGIANKAQVVGVTVVVTAISAALFVAGVLLLRRNAIELSDTTLSVTATFYVRTVPRTDIAWADARSVDFAREPELVPRTRINGIGLPGYRAGWFRLANGDRAFLLTTDDPVVWLPVRDGEPLLLSVAPTSPLFEMIGESIGESIDNTSR